MITPGRRKRHTELRAKRWGTKPAPKDPNNWRLAFLPAWLTSRVPAPKRAGSDRHDPAYLEYMRGFACAWCGCEPPNVAAHVVTAAGQKGMSLKVHDRQAIPLCVTCHDFFDGRTDGEDNPFADWDLERKREWAARVVAKMNELAEPGDSFDRAVELQGLGLGVVVPLAAGAWAWVAGPSVDDSERLPKAEARDDGGRCAPVVDDRREGESTDTDFGTRGPDSDPAVRTPPWSGSPGGTDGGSTTVGLGLPGEVDLW